VDGEPPPVGSPLRIELRHPSRNEEIEFPGVVVRHGEGEAGAKLLGIRLESTDTAVSTGSLIESLQAADHERRLGLIRGPIQALGLPNLMQMFSSCAEAGTLRVFRGGEEGVIAFADGTLRYALLGQVSGAKAMARLFAWQEGSFEFDTAAEPRDVPDEPMPIYGLVMEALRQLDELGRIETDALRPGAQVLIDREPASDDLDALEAALLERVRAGGATVRSLLDAVAEPDADIYRALEALVDRGSLCVLG
jgi:hypothetical protein